MTIGDLAPDLVFATGPAATKRLSDWGGAPVVLVFLRHLA
jgi:hypothetical protein